MPAIASVSSCDSAKRRYRDPSLPHNLFISGETKYVNHPLSWVLFHPFRRRSYRSNLPRDHLRHRRYEFPSLNAPVDSPITAPLRRTVLLAVLVFELPGSGLANGAERVQIGDVPCTLNSASVASSVALGG